MDKLIETETVHDSQIIAENFLQICRSRQKSEEIKAPF
jgi:hypothetical protein